MKISLKLTGDRMVQHLLAQIPEELARRTLRRAVTAAAKPVLADMKARAPVGTGLLRESLGTAIRSYRRGRTAVAVLGPRIQFTGRVRKKLKGDAAKAKPSNYAHLVELGVRPHAVGRGSRILRAGRSPGTKLKQTGGQHPGSPARPFIRPAVDAMGLQALEAMKMELADAIHAAWGRAR